MNLYDLCTGGRTEYARVLTELVRKRINDDYQYSTVVLDSHMISTLRAVTDEELVLFRTKVLRYRMQQYTLPTPCSLGTLVETVRGIVDDLRGSLMTENKFDLEWVGSELVFVPTLRHRFACVLTTSVGETKEYTCLDLDDFYIAQVHPLFDQMADGVDEVPEDMHELVRDRCALSVYDLRLQRFLLSPLEVAYAKWVIHNCV
jgi:hypothetical protein